MPRWSSGWSRCEIELCGRIPGALSSPLIGMDVWWKITIAACVAFVVSIVALLRARQLRRRRPRLSPTTSWDPELFDWRQFPGPKYYRPDHVAPSLRQLATVNARKVSALPALGFGTPSGTTTPVSYIPLPCPLLAVW